MDELTANGLQQFCAMVQRNRRQENIPAGGLLFSRVFLFAVRKIVLHPLRVFLYREFPSLAFIPQMNGLIPPFFELILFDLPHLFPGDVAAVVSVVHTKGRPTSGLFLEVLLRRQLPASPVAPFLHAVTVPGIEVPLDLTSDIAVAAFFATTQLQNGRFVPVENGIGSISRMLILMGMMEDDEIFRPVGLQPFKRPGQQCAFGIKLAEEQTIDDLQFVDTLQFHQDRACGQAFLDLFGSEMPNSLFPQETIARIGTKIRRSNIVTQAAVSAYCKEQGLSQDTVKQTLEGMGISVEPKPVFDPSPRQLAKDRMQVMRHGAFGGEIIFRRLTYLPEG